MSAKDVITLVLSGLALAVSVIATAYGVWRQRRESDRQFLERITDITSALIDARAKVREIDSAPADQKGPEVDYVRGNQVQRMIVLARQADYMVTDKTMRLLSDVNYLAMAQAFAVLGDTAQAERYWALACATPTRAAYQALNRRMYGDYLFNQGRPDEGRAQYESAIGDLSASPEGRDYSQIGLVYENWMVSEARSGFADQARAVEQKAKESYGRIPNERQREWALTRLE